MDWEAIKRAMEANKIMDNSAVKKTLRQKRLLEESGVDVRQMQEQTALVRASSLDRQNYTVNVKPLLELIEAIRRPLPPEWMQMKKDFDKSLLGLGQSILEIREAMNSAFAPLRQSFERWQEANRQLNEVVRNAPPNSLLGLLARNATDVYQANADILARRIEERDLLNSNPALASRMVLPAVSYVDFSQRTVERIGGSDDPEERAALGGSLLIAEKQVTESTGLIVEVTAESVIDVAPDHAPSQAGTTYGIYDAVQLDLIDVNNLPADATYPVLLRFSSAASLAELTRRALATLVRCNKDSRLHGGNEIFKPTAQWYEALIALPGAVVRDESSLRDVITFLYMLIYEGAGYKNLRFLKEHGGYMDRTECDAVWNLKALRNKWLLHDPEHGDAKSIDKSYRSLGAALRSFGLDRFPREKGEFEELQRRMLECLQEFLTKLEDRITAAGGGTLSGS
jgi:hypothetical protein